MDSINNDLDKIGENDAFDTENPFYKLLEKQATEFELFGQRLKSEIRNSHREFTKFQQQQQQQQRQQESTQEDHDSQKNRPQEVQIPKENIRTRTEELEMDSLKARIEELETDIIIKGQDIERQKTEIKQLQESNKNNRKELEKMRREVKELNDFKANFTLIFDSFEQIKLDVNELKYKLQQKDVENDRLLAEQLQINENENNNRMLAEQYPMYNSTDYVIDGVNSDSGDDIMEPTVPTVSTASRTPLVSPYSFGPDSPVLPTNDRNNPFVYSNPFETTVQNVSNVPNIPPPSRVSNLDNLSNKHFSQYNVKRSNTYTLGPRGTRSATPPVISPVPPPPPKFHSIPVPAKKPATKK